MQFETQFSQQPISNSAALSIKSNLCATCLDDKVLVTDLATGKRLHTLETDGEPCSALIFSDDLDYLVAASKSLQLHFFNLRTDQVKVLSKAHESAILSLVIDPTSTLVASGGAEGAVKVWDLRSAKLTHNLKGHGSLVTSLSLYGELGQSNWKLASGGDDGKIIMWDLVKSRQQAQLNTHTSTITALRWTSTGQALISGGRDKVVCIWIGTECRALVPLPEEINSINLLNNQIYVGLTQSIKAINLQAEVVDSWELDSAESDLGFVLLDNNHLFAFLTDQTIVKLSADPELQVTNHLSLNHNEIIDLAVLKDCAVICTNSKDLRIIKISEQLEFEKLEGHTDIVIAIDALRDFVLTGGKDKTAKLWNIKTKQCVITLEGHTGSIGAVALSKSTSYPEFVLTGSSDLTIKKWQADGTAEYTRKAHDKDINAIDVSPNNKYFATASQDRTIKVWNLENGEVIGVLRGHKRGVWDVKFGPNNTLISGSGDKTVKVWDLSNYTCTKTYEGHTNSVLKVLYLQNFIASAGGDGLVKVWHNDECVATLDNHEDKVWSLALTHQKPPQLISVSGDAVLNVWRDSTEEHQIEAAKQAEEQIELQQSLENCVRNKQYKKAVKLALKLDKPLKLLQLLQSVASEATPTNITGIDDVLQSLEMPDFKRLIKVLKQWNTNTRTALTAQKVLNALSKDPNSADKFVHVRNDIEALKVYTQSHLQRVETLLTQSYALDYLLKSM